MATPEEFREQFSERVEAYEERLNDERTAELVAESGRELEYAKRARENEEEVEKTRQMGIRAAELLDDAGSLAPPTIYIPASRAHISVRKRRTPRLFLPDKIERSVEAIPEADETKAWMVKSWKSGEVKESYVDVTDPDQWGRTDTLTLNQYSHAFLIAKRGLCVSSRQDSIAHAEDYSIQNSFSLSAARWIDRWELPDHLKLLTFEEMMQDAIVSLLKQHKVI